MEIHWHLMRFSVEKGDLYPIVEWKKGVCLYLLHSELPKAQCFNATTLSLVNSGVGWQFGLCLAGLNHVSVLSCQFGWEVTCSFLRSILQPSRWGLYACCWKVQDNSGSTVHVFVKSLLVSRLPCTLMLTQCNHMDNPRVDRYSELSRRGVNTGKWINDSYFCRHHKASVCMANVQWREDSFI